MDGANASAVVYTRVDMAKAHGLNIYGYLKFLLEHRQSKDMTDEQLAELAEKMLKRGIKEAVVDKIFFENAERFFRENV